MIRSLRKLLDAPRVRDVLRIVGGLPAKKGGMTMPDGSPVTVPHVMSIFGCSEEYAENFVRRHA